MKENEFMSIRDRAILLEKRITRLVDLIDEERTEAKQMLSHTRFIEAKSRELTERVLILADRAGRK